jgi:hypothetical protein
MNPFGCCLDQESLMLVILCDEHSFRLQDQTADSGANDAASLAEKHNEILLFSWRLWVSNWMTVLL